MASDYLLQSAILLWEIMFSPSLSSNKSPNKFIPGIYTIVIKLFCFPVTISQASNKSVPCLDKF
jgi:hypothetical protein